MYSYRLHGLININFVLLMGKYIVLELFSFTQIIYPVVRISSTIAGMAINYMKVPSSKGAHKLIDTLQAALDAGKHTLWLVSGGTNVSIESFVAANLNLKGGLITAALIDERFGEPGHRDSNFEKFVIADFPVEKLKLAPILAKDKDIDSITLAYEQKMTQLLKEADLVIGQLGLGADGHTAGVLPHSPAVESTKLVEHYQGPDFNRITLTLTALQRISTAYVFAYGDNKHAALTNLKQHIFPLEEQPCQIFKQIPSVYVYNDLIQGDES
jgi:6-phosphogluconolactonase/glucosamine-6-phosphate isomerase/deaminase